jgi:hypothetical protein
MSNELASVNSSSLDVHPLPKQRDNLQSFNKTLSICEALMSTPHYSRLGREGIFAIVSKATALNIDPMDALNGALYFVQGKVEMTSQMMNQLIRQAGHSIKKDDCSNNILCVLHGKRADNGDEWTESFSIEEAQLAGLIKKENPWVKYPRDMLFARALSRLARQLFPDVIKGCYVEGEIQSNFYPDQRGQAAITTKAISSEEAVALQKILDKVPAFKERAMAFLQEKFKISALEQMNKVIYNRIRDAAYEQIEKDQQTELLEGNND